jgi:hypothetical protein
VCSQVEEGHAVAAAEETLLEQAARIHEVLENAAVHGAQKELLLESEAADARQAVSESQSQLLKSKSEAENALLKILQDTQKLEFSILSADAAREQASQVESYERWVRLDCGESNWEPRTPFPL